MNDRRPRLRARLPVLAILVLPHVSVPTIAQDVAIIGSWQGTSACVDKVHFPACKDERVIYDVRRIGSSTDTVTLRADKVVNGVREFMAEFEFSRGPDSAWAATFENQRVRIRIVLRVHGSQMMGVVTDEPSARRIREISVERVP